MYNCRIRAAVDDAKSPHGIKRLSGLLGTKGVNQWLDIQFGASNVTKHPCCQWHVPVLFSALISILRFSPWRCCKIPGLGPQKPCSVCEGQAEDSAPGTAQQAGN